MRVSPIDLNSCGSCNFHPVVSSLKKDGPTIFDDISGESSKNTDLAALLFETINNLNQSAYGPRDKVTRDPGFINLWIQYPNKIIKRLSLKIVHPLDSDDVKMEKIHRWVVENIEYMSDQDQYGYPELWVPPIMLLRTRKGDCEDGAFLIMSLGLNAGVDPKRLRMYGGFVDAGRGAPSGSHGWLAYRRESDNEWVALDFSYYPDLGPMDYKTPLKDDMKYVDDYFFFTNHYIVVTENTNRIRNPDVYYSNARVIPNIFYPSGSLLSRYA